MARKNYIPTISELQAFLACAETGATTRGAQRLNLTQSAISRSINSLENRLGVSLFDRVRQRLVLSDAGRALQRDTARLLADVEQAATGVMAFGGHSNVLRLAVLPTFASRWFIGKLPQFQKLMPNMTFDISARLQNVDFETEPFDGAIQRGMSRLAGLKSIKIMDEYLVAVAAPGLVGQDVDQDEFLPADWPLLQQATRPNLWPDWFLDQGLDARKILRGARFDHFDMVIEAAVNGMGVGLVPEILVSREISTGQLVQLSNRRLAGADPYALIFPERSENRQEFTAFSNWIVGLAQG